MTLATIQPASHRCRHEQSPSSAETSRTAQSASKAASLFWLSALLRPIRGFRLSYLPLAMIYFAYGAG